MTVYTLDKRNHRILSINIFLYRAYKFYKKINRKVLNNNFEFFIIEGVGKFIIRKKLGAVVCKRHGNAGAQIALMANHIHSNLLM